VNENAWIHVPALERLAEAKFFSEKFGSTREMREVRYYLSAFLSAANNVDNLMYHQFGDQAGFKESWRKNVEEAGPASAQILLSTNDIDSEVARRETIEYLTEEMERVAKSLGQHRVRLDSNLIRR
jgi:hypothetical protein